MSNMNQNHNILADRTMKLYADPQDNSVVKYDKKQPAELKVTVKDNRIKIIVTTNIEGDMKNYGKIESEHDLKSFLAVCEMVRRGSLGEIDLQVPIKLASKRPNFAKQGNGPSEKIVQSQLYLGRKEDTGQLYIALIAGDTRPKIRFIFRNSDDHEMMQGDAPMDPKILSEVWACAWANSMAHVVTQVVRVQYQSWQEIKERKANNRQGGGGGYQNNQGGGGYSNNQGGNQNQSSSNQSGGYDEDVSMW